jgi:general secretion pathway protein L
MRNVCFISLDADLGTLPTWFVSDADGTLVSEPITGDWGRLTEAARDCLVIGLLPGSITTIKHTSLPAQLRPRWPQAIPYALEEELASPIEDLHFAIFSQNDMTEQTVITADKAWLRDALNLLKANNLSPSHFVPVSLCLPLEDDHWTVFVTESAVLARTDRAHAFAADRPNLATLLGLIRQTPEAQGKAPAIYNFTDDAIDETTRLIEEPLWQMIAKGALANRQYDVLTGEFRPRPSRAPRRAWQAAMVASFCLLTVYFGGLILSMSVLQHRSSQLDTKIAALYKQVFPNATQVVSPRLRIQRKLQAESGHEQDVFLLLNTLSETTPDARQVTIQQLNYQNQQLKLRLQGKRFSDLSALASKLRAKGLALKQTSATTHKQGVQAQWLIQERHH